jgi:hypothetical protein
MHGKRQVNGDALAERRALPGVAEDEWLDTATLDLVVDEEIEAHLGSNPGVGLVAKETG